MSLVELVDLGAFAIGVGTGAAIAALWLRQVIRRYVLPCGSAHCPHHRTRPPAVDV